MTWGNADSELEKGSEWSEMGADGWMGRVCSRGNCFVLTNELFVMNFHELAVVDFRQLEIFKLLTSKIEFLVKI